MKNKKSMSTTVTTLSIIIISITVFLVALPAYRLTVGSMRDLQEIVSPDDDDLHRLGRSSARFSTTRSNINVDRQVPYLFPLVINNIFTSSHSDDNQTYFYLEAQCYNSSNMEKKCTDFSEHDDEGIFGTEEGDDKGIFGPFLIGTGDYDIVDITFSIDSDYKEGEYYIHVISYYSQEYHSFPDNDDWSEYDDLSFLIELS